MSQPLVSVIVPIYNASKYLRKCLDSLMNQSYVNCEFVLIDDGSFDDSKHICMEYCAKDQRFTYISQVNQGVAAARNHGLDVAKGEYISFVDSDDFIETDMIMKMIHAILDSQADVVECSVNLVNSHYNLISKQSLSDRLIKSNQEIVTRYAMQNNVLNYTCNKIFKADIISEVRFPRLKASEDYCFNVMALNRCRRMITLSHTLYNYVLHDKSATGQSFQLRRLDSIQGGIDVYNNQKDRYPECTEYYVVYILEKIMFEFDRVQSSGIDFGLKRSVSKDLLIKFRKFSPEVSKETLVNMELGFRWKHYIIFRIFPNAYTFFYRMYKKIAKNYD